MPDVLLATCASLPAGDEDGELLREALAAHGVDAAWAAWTDASVPWGSATVVLRSTWDYTLDRDAFLAWTAGLREVHNGADVVVWNSDKTYLADLARAGVAITPTAFAPPGCEVVFPDAAEFVLKPSVGAGSRGAGRFSSALVDEARSHAAMLHRAGRTVLVQPYLEAVDETGETALIYFDGIFSHAVGKGPMLASRHAHPLDESAGLYIEENISPREPSGAELAVGGAAVDALRQRFGSAPLYARVDLLPSPDGPVVVELELTEPSLFLQYGNGDAALSAFARSIASRL